MIERIPFGSTGHHSSRIIFGAAALGAMKQARAEATLDQALAAGVNHIDTAASYGDSELRLAPWLREHRKDVFLATKTGERTATEAREQLHRSLERLGVDQVDLIQLHNLTDEPGWAMAMGAGGAVEALAAARDEGLVQYIGVTGHGTLAAAMHLKSLKAFPFASVLTPYNPSMLAQEDYRQDLEQLLHYCRDNGVAVQTIKAIAQRRWNDADQDKRFSWYKPLRDPAAITRAVHFVLREPGLFLNSSSDATLLEATLAAAAAPAPDDLDTQLAADQQAYAVEPLFVRGVSDVI